MQRSRCLRSVLRRGVISSATSPWPYEGRLANEARRQELERGQMTKAEMIEAVAKSASVTKVDAERTIGAFFDHVVTSTKKGDKVAWPGFGSFSSSKRAARTGRNPQTGEPVKIAASTVLRFSPSATLKTALNPKRKK